MYAYEEQAASFCLFLLRLLSECSKRLLLFPFPWRAGFDERGDNWFSYLTYQMHHQLSCLVVAVAPWKVNYAPSTKNGRHTHSSRQHLTPFLESPCNVVCAISRYKLPVNIYTMTTRNILRAPARWWTTRQEPMKCGPCPSQQPSLGWSLFRCCGPVGGWVGEEDVFHTNTPTHSQRDFFPNALFQRDNSHGLLYKPIKRFIGISAG